MIYYAEKTSASGGKEIHFAGSQLDWSYDQYNGWHSDPWNGEVIIDEPFSIEGGEGEMLFLGASNKTIEHLDWIDTSQATNFRSMFFGCWLLQSIDLSSWDISNVTDMFQCFSNCSDLRSVNLVGWNVSNCDNMSSMFSDCWYLTTVLVARDTDWREEAPDWVDSSDMFYNCRVLPGYNEYADNDISLANNRGGYFGVGVKLYDFDLYEKESNAWVRKKIFLKDSGSWAEYKVRNYD